MPLTGAVLESLGKIAAKRAATDSDSVGGVPARWVVSPTSTDVVAEERTVGTIRTLGRFGSRALALSMIRREVEPGTVVLGGGVPASVIDLPEWGEALRAG